MAMMYKVVLAKSQSERSKTARARTLRTLTGMYHYTVSDSETGLKVRNWARMYFERTECT